MIGRFNHHFDILPAAQKKLWPDLADFKNRFVLYGGTALALRLGHRQSVDFDFFSEEDLDHEWILAHIPSPGPDSVLQSEKNTYTILFPVGNLFVKLSFFGGIDFGRVGSPELTQDNTLLVASPQDLMATKLKVIMQRVEMKDYMDTSALILEGLPLETGLASTLALFGNAFSPSDCLRALEYFEDPNLADLDDETRNTIRKEVKRVLNLDSLPVVAKISESLR